MDRVLGLFTCAAVLFGCAPVTGAPFPSTFQMIGPNQFQFIAGGNDDYPANTRTGEQGRIAWLSSYLTQNGFCANGYEIIQRIPEGLVASAKRGVEDQRYRSITYVLGCKSAASRGGEH